LNDRVSFVTRRGFAGSLTALMVLGAACTSGGGAKAEPVEGGTLTVALTEPKSLDPGKAADPEDEASSRAAALVISQICDPLVTANPATGALRPGVAASWTVAPDAKTFTFKLRPGVKFHNGREVTATDFVYSLTRVAAPGGSAEHFFLSAVAGYKDLREGRAQNLAGVKAVDAATLEIDLSSPFAELPAVLSNPLIGSPVPKEEVDKGADAFAANPICTGPYRMEAPWAKGQDLKLVRFGDYYGDNPAYSKGGRGYAGRVVFKMVADQLTGYRLFVSGGAAVAEVSTDDLTSAHRAGRRVVDGSNGIVTYIGLPVTKPPFDNADFRRALALAVNRKAIVQGLLAGMRTVPGGFLPPGAGPGAAHQTCANLPSDAKPDAARKALKVSGAGPASVKPVIYYNDGSSGNEAWLGKVAEQWKSTLGIETTLHSDEWKKYLDFLVDPGPDGPFRLAWPVEYPSPESLFGPLFLTGSLDNFTRFSDKEFDDLIARARGAVNDKQRAGLYKQAAAVLCDRMPVIPMWFGQDHWAFASSLAAGRSVFLGVNGLPVLREAGRRS
jgi:ABC-type transport system substrate-binding protein